MPVCNKDFFIKNITPSVNWQVTGGFVFLGSLAIATVACVSSVKKLTGKCSSEKKESAKNKYSLKC
jgi:hypothetical protein